MPTLVLGFLALSAGAYRYIHNLIKQELTASMLATTRKTAETIRDFSVIDIQNIYRHRILHEKYPDIFKDIYAANRHGEYHTVRERGSKYFIFVGNIADRPHFKSIMSGGTAQITPPLVSRTTSIPTIFFVAPKGWCRSPTIYRNGHIGREHEETFPAFQPSSTSLRQRRRG